MQALKFDWRRIAEQVTAVYRAVKMAAPCQAQQLSYRRARRLAWITRTLSNGLSIERGSRLQHASTARIDHSFSYPVGAVKAADSASNLSHNDPPIAVHHDFSQSRIDIGQLRGDIRFVNPSLITRWGDISLVHATWPRFASFS